MRKRGMEELVGKMINYNRIYLDQIRADLSRLEQILRDFITSDKLKLPSPYLHNFLMHTLILCSKCDLIVE
jgi:hypothetical protein